MTRLYVFLTAVIVLVAPHWYINKANNTEVGLVRALTCPTPSTCTILPSTCLCVCVK